MASLGEWKLGCGCRLISWQEMFSWRVRSHTPSAIPAIFSTSWSSVLSRAEGASFGGADSCYWFRRRAPAEVLALMAAAKLLMLAVRARLSLASASLSSSCFFNFLSIAAKCDSIWTSTLWSSWTWPFGSLPSFSVTLTRWWFGHYQLASNCRIGGGHRVWPLDQLMDRFSVQC